MHVAMIRTPNAFCDGWTAAAARFATVTEILPVNQLTGVAVADSETVAVDSDNPASVQVLGVRGVSRPLWGRWQLARYAARLVEAIHDIEQRRGPVDLVHAHFYSNSFALPRVRRLLGKPYVITEHSTAFTDMNPENVLRARSLRLARPAYRDAAGIYPVSEFLAHAMRKRAVHEDLTVVPNPVDSSRFRLWLKGPAPEVVVGVSARLVPMKRVDMLLRAARRMVDEGFDLRVVVLGDGPELDSLSGLAAELGLAERVEFTGWVAAATIGDVLAGCDAFALPSVVETHSVSCVEALLSGLPVVTFGAGPMDEYIDRSNGYLAVPDDEADFTAGLRLVVENLEAYDRVKIRRDAIRKFGLEAVSLRLHAAYAAALSRSECDGL